MATLMYPLTTIHLEVDGERMEVEAAIVDRLPMDVLLGTDVPQLEKLQMGPKDDRAMVMTRAATRQAETKRLEEERLQQEF